MFPDRRMRRLLLVTIAFFFFFFLLKQHPSGGRRSFYRPIPDSPPSPAIPPNPPPPDPPGSIKHHLPPPNAHPSVPSLQPIQFFFSPWYKQSNGTLARRAAVKRAFVKSWTGYKTGAYPADELGPVTGKGKVTTALGLGAGLVEGLDTLWVMGLKEEFYEAAEEVYKMDFSFFKGRRKNEGGGDDMWRFLGGLLAGYDLSGEWGLLEKAEELGGLLLKEGMGGGREGGWLEFTRLGQLTGDKRYYDAVGRGVDALEEGQDGTGLRGMWPGVGGKGGKEVYSLGKGGGGVYGNLPKMAALLGRGRPGRFEGMWKAAMGVVEEWLLFRPMLGDEDRDEVGDRRDILLVGDVRVKGDKAEQVPEGQHLGCYAGGMFGVGGKLFGNEEYVKIGEQLARGCAWAYGAFPTGLMPEVFEVVPCEGDWRDGPCRFDEDQWRKDGSRKLNKPFKSVRDPKYMLRPEAIESLFIMFRITGNKEYQELAWEMFQSVVKATETELAFSAIGDVTVHGPTKKIDSMESYWLAETLKYFYLIFSPPDLISLDEWILSTGAHPLRRDSSGFITRGFDEPPRPKRKKNKPAVP
ncbi:glycoside hydrolase [Cercophora samala]|uniref:alpha-1,2-Mannosidase n=1 Tax=Cercophora samala TaxID=330535 RepID=A0AA40DC12_9PEZI|nr:glycoside hydrolase [Cercophora samala]